MATFVTPGATFDSLLAEIARGSNLPGLPKVGSGTKAQFDPTGGGGGVINIPVIGGLPGGGGSGGTPGIITKAAANQAAACVPALSNLYCLFSGGSTGGIVGNQFLRLILLILGLICIIGAIYLYKPTSGVVTAPLRAAKGAIKAAAKEAAAGEE